MTALDTRPAWRRHLLLLSVSLSVLLFDQLTKVWIRSFLALGESFPSDWPVRFTYVQNTGIAFGIKANQIFLVFVTMAVVLSLLFVSIRYHMFQTRAVRLGLALMMGGATGNLIDRVGLGYVTDFVDLQVWPVFNVADSAVVVGVGLLSYFFLFHPQAKPRKPA